MKLVNVSVVLLCQVLSLKGLEAMQHGSRGPDLQVLTSAF